MLIANLDSTGGTSEEPPERGTRDSRESSCLATRGAQAVLGADRKRRMRTNIVYLQGHGLLGEKGTTWVWHLGDGLGSVRQLADSSGNVALAQGYTPFGVPMWDEGSGATGYGFTGERWEAYSQLVFLRTRYYQPETGRFFNKDPWPGMQQSPMSLHSYLYANNSPAMYVDPVGLYSCILNEQWPPELIPFCILLDESFEARRLFYASLVTVMSGMGWRDASVLLDHYLVGSGQPMYFGSRLVGLVEKDARSLIENSRTKYLLSAAQMMKGGIGNLPRGGERDFLSNTEGLPEWYAPNPYRVSRELFIAIGGVWFNRFYGGTVKEDSQGTYRISLLTVFTIDKWWSFEPNTEMYPPGTEDIPENPPAEFNFAEFLGLPRWWPRPPPLLISPQWSVYIPDEWAHSLETEGNAASYRLHGRWARNEEFTAIDRNCDGWSVDEIVEGPTITRELLPTSLDPSSNASLQWFCR